MINHNFYSPSEEELILMRKELYHSQKPGYIIFKNFIPKSWVKHMITFWTESIDLKKTHTILHKKEDIYFGCKNSYNYNTGDDNVSIRNYLWNHPNDMVTQSVAFTVQLLRNTLMAKQIYNEFYPINGRCLIPRIVITKTGSPVPMHTDWADGEDFDPSRLQATLFLTKRAKDYEGKGFVFKENSGKEVVFDLDVEVNPGDLVIWRYNNEHGVQAINTKGDQKGFIRMIFPQEKIYEAPKVKQKSLLKNIAKKILK